MTTRTRRKLHTWNALHAFGSMHAHDLFVGNLGMTAFAIHRIEPAPVPALCADMAIEAFRRTVRRALKECHINFVAIITRVLLLGVDGL